MCVCVCNTHIGSDMLVNVEELAYLEKNKKALVCNVCWFPWYKYSLQDQFQATNVIPENLTALTSQCKPVPAY